MLGKAATHFRPLLRFQTATHQPDLFTSNPSLLHHFQNSQGLVVHGTAQAAAGSGGAAGGAGRAGYSSASGGGGYTGHARAFLSLPQGSAADPSSIGTSSDEAKDKELRGQRALVLRHRAAIRDESTLPRTVTVRERLNQRSGSRPVVVREIEPEVKPRSRRPSIAYPSWAALPADATPGGALWLPGDAPRPIGARAFSTQARATNDMADEIVSASPRPGSNRLVQPNHVLQDLAGLDLARPGRVGQVRRNSTASVVRPDLSAPEFISDADRKIYREFDEVKNDKAATEALIAHYRTPRNPGDSVTGDARLAKRLPLPSGFSTETYNRCLIATLHFRERGESIAPVLDMYNEMLVRDVVPNLRTTSLVIHALCEREQDIAEASRRWAEGQEWNSIKAEHLNLNRDHFDVQKDANAAIEGYHAEENLASALNLWQVAQTFYPSTIKKELRPILDILTAAASSSAYSHSLPLKQLVPVIEAALELEAEALIYEPIFKLLASAGSKEYFELVDKAWQQYSANPSQSMDRDIAAAAVRAYLATGSESSAAKIAESRKEKRVARNINGALVSAYAKKGDVDNSLKHFEASDKLIPEADMFELAALLVQKGRVADAKKVVNQYKGAVDVEMPGTYVNRYQIRRLYGMALGHALKSKDPKAIDAAADLMTIVPLVPDPAVLYRHVEKLLALKRYSDIPKLFLRHQAKVTQNIWLRHLISAVVKSEAPLTVVLETLRGVARFGEPVSSDRDQESIPTLVVNKYLAARAGVETAAELSLSQDSWFRLLETIVALPFEYVNMGSGDKALETYMEDLSSFAGTRFPLPSGFSSSPAVGELADILSARFGVERASELLTAAFGDKAAAFLPTPEATVAPTSEAEFTLPPTPTSADAPPSSFQPPSAHTLHLAPELDSMINRLNIPGGQAVPQDLYAKVREQITSHNSVPSPDGIARLIVALARANEEAKARELYSLAQVVLASCVPEPHAQAEGWRAVEDAMIAGCCFLGHLEQAGMHRARIIEAGMAPSADAYATMIACSRDSTDDALVARELFDESQALGVVPHLYLFNTIISKLSKARKAEMALELFNHMKAAGIRPSSVTYGAVINACCRVGDEESAAILFKEMSEQPNFRPRVPPFNTMMQFHLQTHPSREKVLEYYDAMRSHGVRPSAHTYKLLLDAYGTLEPIDLPAMDRVFGDLCADRKVPVQATHWASLITAFGLYADDLPRALAVFDGIARHPSSSSAVPEPVAWEAILNVVGQRGSLAQLDSLRERMARSGARHTAYVCNVLIAGYSRHGQVDRARDIFNGMADSMTGVAAPNNHPALLTSSGHVKPATITNATDVVFREPSTYEAMVRAELAAGNRPQAEEVLRRMEERRYPVAVWMKARAILDEAQV